MKKLYSLLLLGGFAVAAVAAPNVKSKAAIHKASSLAAPVVLPATDITDEGFTANWQTYPGATTYTLSVYNPVKAPSDGEFVILSENFNLVNKGSVSEPYFPEESFVELSDYDWTYTPDWQGFWPVFSKGMVGGIIYSPYIDLTNDGGKFTVNFSVVGYSGGLVKLTSTGETTETAEFICTQTGSNEFSHTFTNGCHDTYITFVDYGIPGDEDNLYADYYDFLDDIEFVQTLKKGDLVLGPVACVEPSQNFYTFESLLYAYGAKNLAYDVQANIVEFNDPDDPWDYDVTRTPFSSLQYVQLGSSNPGTEPVDPGTDPDDPKNDDDVLGDFTFYVGEFENPGKNEITQGAGSWWERAPFQWYTVYSGSQMIYNAEYLSGLKPGDLIKEVVFKYGDEGSFVNVEADLTLYIENTDVTTFPKKNDSDTYLWVDMDASSSKSQLKYDIDLYYMIDEEIHFVLDQPLVYEGGNLLITCWSERTNDLEAQCVITYAMRTNDYATMSTGDDRVSFPNVYDSGEQFPYHGPNKYLPVTKFNCERNQGVADAVAADAAQAEYYNLQGIRVANPEAGQIYICRKGDKVSKVIVR